MATYDSRLASSLRKLWLVWMLFWLGNRILYYVYLYLKYIYNTFPGVALGRNKGVVFSCAVSAELEGRNGANGGVEIAYCLGRRMPGKGRGRLRWDRSCCRESS